MSTLSAETPLQTAPPLPGPQTPVASAAWRRATVFGTGFGIAIGAADLEVAIARARPSGPAAVATTSISDFRNRPAADWGAEIQRFIAAADAGRLAATVLLPRSEVIVRSLSLPGVTDKDAPSAIELQIDTLHPWGDVEIAWGWSRAAKNDFLIGLVRRDVLDSYEALFSEAGIPMAAATFSSAVIHAALRIWSETPVTSLCFIADESGRTEIYGESEARPVFSAEFPLPRDRAIALAQAELRVGADHPAVALAELLPMGKGTALLGSASALAYAAALAGSVPRAVRFANLLPPERRATHNRLQYVIPGILCTLLLLALLAVFVIFPALDQKRYRDDLARAARQLEPAAARAQAVDRTVNADRARIGALDEIRRRPQADLEVLNELTRLLPPPVWTSAIEIYPDSVVITGEADQAAPLLKVLDSSTLFQNSEFALSLTRTNQSEQFRIKTYRRGRTGRTTP